MSPIKDYFSTQSDDYLKFRPGYPPHVLDYILQRVSHLDHAWDVGCGSGQLTRLLADHFLKVEASDISLNQLSRAPGLKNVKYHQSAAHLASFPPDTFDLIIAAQAAHWFDLRAFYETANQVSKPNGSIALLGYKISVLEDPWNELFYDFYLNTLGDFWPPERKWVDEGYKSFEFPFEMEEYREFEFTEMRSLKEVCGYMRSWSAWVKYVEANGRDPVLAIENEWQKKWPKGQKIQFSIPYFIKSGRIIK